MTREDIPKMKDALALIVRCERCMGCVSNDLDTIMRVICCDLVMGDGLGIDEMLIYASRISETLNRLWMMLKKAEERFEKHAR